MLCALQGGEDIKEISISEIAEGIDKPVDEKLYPKTAERLKVIYKNKELAQTRAARFQWALDYLQRNSDPVPEGPSDGSSDGSGEVVALAPAPEVPSEGSSEAVALVARSSEGVALEDDLSPYDHALKGIMTMAKRSAELRRFGVESNLPDRMRAEIGKERYEAQREHQYYMRNIGLPPPSGGSSRQRFDEIMGKDGDRLLLWGPEQRKVEDLDKIVAVQLSPDDPGDIAEEQERITEEGGSPAGTYVITDDEWKAHQIRWGETQAKINETAEMEEAEIEKEWVKAREEKMNEFMEVNAEFQGLEMSIWDRADEDDEDDEEPKDKSAYQIWREKTRPWRKFSEVNPTLRPNEYNRKALSEEDFLHGEDYGEDEMKEAILLDQRILSLDQARMLAADDLANIDRFRRALANAKEANAAEGYREREV